MFKIRFGIGLLGLLLKYPSLIEVGIWLGFSMSAKMPALVEVKKRVRLTLNASINPTLIHVDVGLYWAYSVY